METLKKVRLIPLQRYKDKTC